MPIPVNTTTNNNNNRNKSDDDKCMKVKRAIVIGVLIALAIIGWHFYEFFLQDKASKDNETSSEHEIHQLTQKLFADELQRNPYLERINFQGKTKTHARDDRAPHPLLNVHDELLSPSSSSTIYLMKRLFDNYELDVRTVEHVTAQEQQEEWDFLNAVMQTAVMKDTMKFLNQKGAVPDDYKSQLQVLKDIWFTQYSRGQGIKGSSGFEHVFLAELRDDSVLGLHNWIYFHEQEQQGNLDYKGFIERVELGKNDKHLLAARFSFHNIVKPYNTLFIGTSPEFELSLYTVCFLLSMDEPCPVELGSTKLSIMTYAWDMHGKKILASAYPQIEK